MGPSLETIGSDRFCINFNFIVTFNLRKVLESCIPLTVSPIYTYFYKNTIPTCRKKIHSHFLFDILPWVGMGSTTNRYDTIPYVPTIHNSLYFPH